MTNTLTIPLTPFKAVQKAQSTEKMRYYLGGVYVEPESLTAMDGRILMRYNTDDAPTGAVEPVILYVDPNEKAMKPKSADNVFMFVDLERRIVETYFVNPRTKKRGDRLGVCACEVIDGTYPRYERVIPDNKLVEPCADFAFDADHITTFAAAAKIMGMKKPVLKFSVGRTNTAPANVHFSGLPRLEGVIMPCKFSDI